MKNLLKRPYSRLEYFLGMLATFPLAIYAAYNPLPMEPTVVDGLVVFVLLVVVLFITYVCTVGRLRDLQLSLWYTALAFVPVVSLGLFIYLIVKK